MKMRILSAFLVVSALGFLSGCDVAGVSADQVDPRKLQTQITNGALFYDTDGNRINAHGGGILRAGLYYYWYGEHRFPDGNFLGVSCYRSEDLINWENMGDALLNTDATELNNCTVERPKVIYNQFTNRYVMWLHLEAANGNYGPARAAVAVAEKPEGPYKYIRSLRPFDDRPDLGITDPEIGGPAGYMSRDCNLFVDTDGTGYFISTWQENALLHIYRLTSDYLAIDTTYIPPVPLDLSRNKRESPCLFKRGDYYYLVTSEATGWKPNQGTVAYSKALAGPWSTQASFGDSTTYRSQPTYVLEVRGTEGSSFLYIGDRWAPAWSGPLVDSEYVLAPIEFDDTGTVVSISYGDALLIDTEKGTISYPPYFNLQTTFTTFKTWSGDDRPWMTASTQKLNLALASSSTNAGVQVVIATPNTTTLHQQWRFETAGESYRLFNRWSGKVLDAGYGSKNGDTLTVTPFVADLESQLWDLIDNSSGNYQLKSKTANRLLDGNRRDKVAQISAEGTYPEIPYTWEPTGGTMARNAALLGQSWALVAVSQ